MAITNHERVGKALELMRVGLKPYVERELKTAFGDKWIDEAVKDERRLKRDGKGDPQKKLLGAYSRHQTSLPRSRPWCLTSYLPYTFWAW